MLGCVSKLKKYFQIDKWQINQPIILSDITSEILAVEGVATIVKPQENRDDLIVIENKWGSGYSANIYAISLATFNGVVYPSVDPAIFEVKYPDINIRGRVMGDL